VGTLRYIKLALLIVFVSLSTVVCGQETGDTISQGQSSKGLIKRIIEYFETSNKPTEQKRFDFSMIGGPHYSSTKSFGVGLVAAGLYKRDLTDTLKQPSYVSVYADVTVKLYCQVGVEGYHIMRNDDWRLDYNVSLENNHTKFWGIGYQNGKDDANETDYRKRQIKSYVGLIHNVGDRFYLGPELRFNYTRGYEVDGDKVLWQGQAMSTTNFGVGVTAAYDTRDNLSNAYSGVYVKLSQMFYPRGIGNKYAFSSTEFKVNWYKPVREGTVIASQIHGLFTYGNTPWGMMALLGSNETMRGYYEGRYIDKDMVDLTVELRQHIYKRNSAVVWVGVGEVFSEDSHLTWSKLLPNYGIGYRWEFKKRVNVRLDWGFGKRQMGVIFSINEAF
jgi:outer membrane protein assembly factor BamA